MAKIALAIGLGIVGAFISVATGGLGTFAVGAWTADIIAGFGVGATAGSVLGGLIFPTKLPNQIGPRLNDLTASGSGPGPIPFGYGEFRYAGQLIWSPGLQEHAKTTKQSSKGGPSYKSTDYTYTASFAVSFGEGPLTIKKIWFDAKVVYDITTGPNTATAYPEPTFYPGDEAQMPDPLIQGDKGVANTPAFRGLGYFVQEDFQLANFGNRIPNIQGLVQFAIGRL